MKKRIGIIGVGTAGIVSICSIIPWVSNDWDVVSIYDPDLKILGIGESTNPNFVQTLETGIGFENIADIARLDGTLKFGTKYKKWRNDDWVNPLFGAGYALHFNNFKLKEFAFERFKEMWPKKFKTLEGKVTNVTTGFKCVNVEINGIVERFDYIIDCRGFPTDFSNYVISDCSPVNSCIVHDMPPNDQEMYTEHIATKNGWMFGIPLTERTTYGYLYNKNLTSREDAISDMEDLLSTKLAKKPIEYSFQAYYIKKIFSNRILSNGNRALFFEPLSASSIYMYIFAADLFISHLNNPMKYSEGYVNSSFETGAKSLEDMISFLYHGGSTFDTPFWHHAKELAIRRLNSNTLLRDTISEYRKYHKLGTPFTGSSWYFTPTNLRIVDKKMGYNYLHEST